ncbi:MAG: MBL fold metallo-hydrolase, partial [Leptolyngbyaceae cyanobacterium SM2_3_12]|nr:MBL fold metallo-hydrolase [Leptolyngbyaceae cyanobacterium SM2_3_12]
GDVVITTYHLNPHTKALGYRVTWQNQSLVYATDTDSLHGSASPDLQLWVQGAKVLIF